jgi:hypothetical protein
MKANDLGRPFQDRQLSYRPVELRGVIEKIFEEQVKISIHNVSWALASRGNRILEILIAPLRNNGNEVIAALAPFVGITAQARLQEKLEHANLDLETTMGELQSSSDEVEVIGEESRRRREDLPRVNCLLEAIVTSLPGGIIGTDAKLHGLSWLRHGETQPQHRAVTDAKSDRVSPTVQAMHRRGKPIECHLSIFPLIMPGIGIWRSILVVEDSLLHPQ